MYSSASSTTSSERSCASVPGEVTSTTCSYVNYHGISVGYGWTGATNAMSNNYINSNNIHHIAQILGDCGGIYTLSNQMPQSQMMSNYIHDYSLPKWADNTPSPIPPLPPVPPPFVSPPPVPPPPPPIAQLDRALAF